MMEEQNLMTQVGTIKQNLYDLYTNIRLSACFRKGQVDWNTLFTCFILFFNEANFIVKPENTKRKLPKDITLIFLKCAIVTDQKL